MDRREHVMERIEGLMTALVELEFEERIYGPNQDIAVRRDMVIRGLDKWRKELCLLVRSNH